MRRILLAATIAIIVTGCGAPAGAPLASDAPMPTPASTPPGSPGPSGNVYENYGY